MQFCYGTALFLKWNTDFTNFHGL